MEAPNLEIPNYKLVSLFFFGIWILYFAIYLDFGTCPLEFYLEFGASYLEFQI